METTMDYCLSLVRMPVPKSLKTNAAQAMERTHMHLLMGVYISIVILEIMWKLLTNLK